MVYFHLLKNMLYFPLLVLKGICHYVLDIFVLFPVELSKWRPFRALHSTHHLEHPKRTARFIETHKEAQQLFEVGKEHVLPNTFLRMLFWDVGWTLETKKGNTPL